LRGWTMMPDDAVNRDGNTVVIGDKPIMNYVVACLTVFNAGASEVKVRARGRHISMAVDAVEMLRRVFLREVIVENVSLGTDTLIDNGGKQVNVSTIEIKLIKPGPSS